MSFSAALPEVFIVSHDFPPHGGGGVIRAAKFAKYLPVSGWRPIVIAADPAAYEAAYHDPSLVARGIEVVHVRYPHRRLGRRLTAPAIAPWPSGRGLRRVAKALLVPDPEVLWVIPALLAIRRLLRSDRPQAVLTTSPPNSSHLVGALAQALFGLTWVVDFRDQWVGNPLYAGGPLRTAIERKLQAFCLERADAIVVTTPELAEVVAQQSSRLPVCIRNGFDPEDLEGLDLDSPEIFTVSHVGSLGSTRDPGSILAGWKAFITEQELIGQARLRLIGPAHQCNLDRILAADPTLAATVEHLVFLPHREALQAMARSSVLLLVTSLEEGCQTAIPGKTYEYLAFRKPLLAIAPPGPLSRLLAEVGAGTTVPPADSRALQAAFAGLFALHQSGRLAAAVPPDAAAPFDRRGQAIRVAALLDAAYARRAESHPGLAQAGTAAPSPSPADARKGAR